MSRWAMRLVAVAVGNGITARVSVVVQVVGAILATGAGLWLSRHV